MNVSAFLQLKKINLPRGIIDYLELYSGQVYQKTENKIVYNQQKPKRTCVCSIYTVTEWQGYDYGIMTGYAINICEWWSNCHFCIFLEHATVSQVLISIYVGGKRQEIKNAYMPCSHTAVLVQFLMQESMHTPILWLPSVSPSQLEIQKVNTKSVLGK